MTPTEHYAMRTLPFAYRGEIPAEVQDEIRKRMEASIPKLARPGDGRATYKFSKTARQRMGEAKRKHGDDTFLKLAPEVGRRLAAGSTMAAIAREIGWSEKTVQRIVRRMKSEAAQ